MSQSREYHNATFQRRRRRVRFDTQSLSEFNLTDWTIKSYDPTARSWYKLGVVQEPGVTAWEGPSLQTANAAGDLVSGVVCAASRRVSS